jgi:anti-sigma regulatory factor (Ser/Thr protein kinase)
MGNMLQVRADARPEYIRPLRDAVANLASETGMSGVQVYAVKLCVGEAIANSVKHAYPESEPGLVDVSAQELGDELVVTVADHGRRRGTFRTHTEDEGGFGLAFISRLTDHCTFVAAHDGTTVEMLFPLRTVKAPVPSRSRLAVRVE